MSRFRFDDNSNRRTTTSDRRVVPRGGRRGDDQVRFVAAVQRYRLEPSASAPLVLVVDDFADGREMTVEYLQFCGFRVSEARTGAEAIELATTLLPDLVLLDVLLPDANGLETAVRLRESDRTKHLKIVICTAAVMNKVREGAASARVDMFIAKPFDLEVLALQIAHLLAHEKASV